MKLENSSVEKLIAYYDGQIKSAVDRSSICEEGSGQWSLYQGKAEGLKLAKAILEIYADEGKQDAV